MVIYRITCDRCHEFEARFLSPATYAGQLQQGLLVCPVCASARLNARPAAGQIVLRREVLAAPQPAGLFGWFQQLRGRLTLAEEHTPGVAVAAASGTLSATPAGPEDTFY